MTKHMEEAHLSEVGSWSPSLKFDESAGTSESVESSLFQIFQLDHGDDAEIEQRILALLETFYPQNGIKLSSAGKHAVDELADWLSHQDAQNRLAVDDPTHAATMLMAMLFGGLASNRRLELPLPTAPDLVIYVKKSIKVFLRGVALVSQQ